MIKIDGSKGEGGGQVLRSSLSLAMVTGQSLSITQIRANRAKPGLKRQHLTAVQAAKSICGATVTGDQIGSTELTFRPQATNPGQYHFAIGTAGSATLVLQTVLPALILADKPSQVVIEGGTHNDFAPPFEFLAQTFLPVLNRMGPTVTATLDQHGFFPAGGGKITATIEPCRNLSPPSLIDRGPLVQKMATILTCQLPPEIAKRQQRMTKNRLNWLAEEVTIQAIKRGRGSGNAVLATLTHEQHTEVFSSIGGPRLSSDQVIAKLVAQIRDYQSSTAPVGEHLADQLMLPFALAGIGHYHVIKASSHALTNKQVIEAFLGPIIQLERTPDGGTKFDFEAQGES